MVATIVLLRALNGEPLPSPRIETGCVAAGRMVHYFMLPIVSRIIAVGCSLVNAFRRDRRFLPSVHRVGEAWAACATANVVRSDAPLVFLSARKVQRWPTLEQIRPSPVNRWIDEAVSARIQPFRPDRPSRRVSGALLAVPKNGYRIALDQALGWLRPPPDGVFRVGSFFDLSQARRVFGTICR
jgi:hypothetical protein